LILAQRRENGAVQYNYILELYLVGTYSEVTLEVTDMSS
jgi:hypothetical protein